MPGQIEASLNSPQEYVPASLPILSIVWQVMFSDSGKITPRALGCWT